MWRWPRHLGDIEVLFRAIPNKGGFGFWSPRHTCLAPVSVSCFQEGLHLRNWWGFRQIDEARGVSWQLSLGIWMAFIQCPKYKCRYLFRHGNAGFAAFSIVFGELCWGSCGSFASHYWLYGVRSCFFGVQKATAAGCRSRIHSTPALWKHVILLWV